MAKVKRHVIKPGDQKSFPKVSRTAHAMRPNAAYHKIYCAMVQWRRCVYHFARARLLY